MTPAALRVLAAGHAWLAFCWRAWGVTDAARDAAREADRLRAAAERMER
jgi:hypothetical protein